MDDSQDSEVKDTMQRFTATGRPYRPHQPAKEGWSVNSLSAAESFGAGPANLLPTRFTDESLITIPVQRPENIGKVAPAKAKKPFISFGWKSKDDFLMKQVPRGEYLKYYAKDESGNYIGRQTLAAAPFCSTTDKGRHGTTRTRLHTARARCCEVRWWCGVQE
jgi:hypothetical protein